MLVTFHHLRVYLVKKGSYYLSSNRFLLHERRGIFLSPTSPPFSWSVSICWYTQETWRNAKKMGEGGGRSTWYDGHPVQGGVSFTTVPLTEFVPFVAKKNILRNFFRDSGGFFSGLQISLLTKVLKSILFTVDTHFLKHKFGILYFLKQGISKTFLDLLSFFQDWK